MLLCDVCNHLATKLCIGKLQAMAYTKFGGKVIANITKQHNEERTDVHIPYQEHASHQKGCEGASDFHRVAHTRDVLGELLKAVFPYLERTADAMLNTRELINLVCVSGCSRAVVLILLL